MSYLLCTKVIGFVLQMKKQNSYRAALLSVSPNSLGKGPLRPQIPVLILIPNLR